MNHRDTVQACKKALSDTHLERSAISTRLSLDDANARLPEERFVHLREFHFILEERDPSARNGVAFIAESIRQARFSQSVTDESGRDLVIARPEHVMIGLAEFTCEAFRRARSDPALCRISFPSDDTVKEILIVDRTVHAEPVQRLYALIPLVRAAREATQALEELRDDPKRRQDFLYFRQLSNLLEGLVHGSQPIVVLDGRADDNRPQHARRYVRYRATNPLPHPQEARGWRFLSAFGRHIRHSLRGPWHTMTVDVPITGGGEEILVKLEGPDEMLLTNVCGHPVRVTVCADSRRTVASPRGFSSTRQNSPLFGPWRSKVWAAIFNRRIGRSDRARLVIPAIQPEPSRIAAGASTARIALRAPSAEGWSERAAIDGVRGQIENLRPKASRYLQEALDEFMGAELRGLTRAASLKVTLREPILTWAYSSAFTIGGVAMALLIVFDRLPGSIWGISSALAALGIIAALAAMWSRSSPTMRYILGTRFVFTTYVAGLILLPGLLLRSWSFLQVIV